MSQIAQCLDVIYIQQMYTAIVAIITLFLSIPIHQALVTTDQCHCEIYEEFVATNSATYHNVVPHFSPSFEYSLMIPRMVQSNPMGVEDTQGSVLSKIQYKKGHFFHNNGSWNCHELSADPALTWEIITAHHELPWDWEQVAKNPNMETVLAEGGVPNC